MAADYTEKLKELLPPGKFWTRALTSVAHQLYTALAKSFGRVVDRAVDLEAEMDPRTTTELIEDWERIAGLPDPCTTAPTLLEERRAALTARIISRGGWSGGPSVPFLTSVITALGYAEEDILIRRFHLEPFTCESECDDFLYSDEGGWRFVWEVIVEHGALDAQLQCQIDKYALGALGVTFAFPLMSFGDGVFSRAGSGVFTDPETGVQTTLAEDELGTVYLGP